MTAFSDANNLGVCGRVYIRLMPGEYRGPGAADQQDVGPGHHPLQHGIGRLEDGDRGQSGGGHGGEHDAVRDADDQGAPRIPDEEHHRRQRLRRGIGAGQQSERGRDAAAERQSQFENVRFIGNIGTLYVKSSVETIKARSYFRDCYIEGDQDFIVGRGTAVFDHSRDQVPGRPAADGRKHRRTRARWCSTATASCSTAATSPRRRARAA